MVVKEEKYDLGYEVVYGGVYGENLCNGEFCGIVLNGLIVYSVELRGEVIFGDVLNGQWMVQLFVEQIFFFNNCGI